MQHGSRDDIKQLNARLVEDYWGGESVTSIATRTGRHISTVHKLVKADIAANGPRARVKKPDDPRIMLNKRVLSARHSWIGIQIARYRAEHDLTPSSLGMTINATRVMVRNMEIGAHDFTLTQVERISELLDIPFLTLITPQWHRSPAHDTTRNRSHALLEDVLASSSAPRSRARTVPDVHRLAHLPDDQEPP